MVKITFQINGPPVDPRNLEQALERAVFESIRNQLESQLSGVRDPDTGESPAVVVRGDDLEHLTLNISGSEKLVLLTKERLGIPADSPAPSVGSPARLQASRRSPCAFICHASENKPLARQIAEEFMKNGIDTFFDEWEIRPGDSIRQKIDGGLTKCTHFIVLLTIESLRKPWVNAEIDAGFLRKLEGHCEFIPVRYELSVESLPPLVRAMYSPGLTECKHDLNELIAHLHGATKKPSVGPIPKILTQSSKGLSGLSAAAEAVVRYAVEHSQTGTFSDPQLSPQLVRDITGLGDDDIIEAVDELESRGFVKLLRSLDAGPIGFVAMAPTSSLFAEFDRYFQDWDPEADALRIAADLVNELRASVVSVLAHRYAWPARRINPAVAYLERRGFAQVSSTIDHPWVRHWIQKNPHTRRFVRERS
jgi:hypothetical protein